MSATASAALADSPTNQLPVAGATTNTTPDSSACLNDVCTYYGYRYPFLKNRRSQRQLTQMSNPNADGGDNTPQNNQDKIADKTTSLDVENGVNPAPSNNQTNALQQSGTGSGTYLAYALVPYNPYQIPYMSPLIINHQTMSNARDADIFYKPIITYGYPITDDQFQTIDREDNQRFLELLFDPEKVMWAAKTVSQLQQGFSGNALAGAAQNGFGNAVSRMTNGDSNGGGGSSGWLGSGSNVGALINVANDSNAAANGYMANSQPLDKTSQDAVYMVQILYKKVFVPMAILFLLPGAIITQVKSQVSQGFGMQGASGNPFEGILRSMIALFLIPTTQLIMSYAIDVGNSLTYSVGSYVQVDTLMGWAGQLMYDPPTTNYDNALIPPQNTSGTTGNTNNGLLGSVSSLAGDFGSFGGSGVGAIIQDIIGLINNIFGMSGDGQGLGNNQPEGQVHLEEQSSLSQMMQILFNMVTTLLTNSVVILSAFQLVFMCYLYLMGPLSAAFYAWPQIGQKLFRNVFSDWFNAVIILALWRFYWMVILAIMSTRLAYMQSHNEPFNLQWEIAVFTCFVGLLFYIPTNPWTFNDPGGTFTAVQQIGSQMVGGPSGNGQGGLAGAAAQQAQAQGVSPGTISQFNSAVSTVTGAMSQSANMTESAILHTNPVAANAYRSDTGGGAPQQPGGQGPGQGQVQGQGQGQGQGQPQTQSPPLTGQQTSEAATPGGAPEQVASMGYPANIPPPPAAVVGLSAADVGLPSGAGGGGGGGMPSQVASLPPEQLGIPPQASLAPVPGTSPSQPQVASNPAVPQSQELASVVQGAAASSPIAAQNMVSGAQPVNMAALTPPPGQDPNQTA
jgi:hypothetical protein